MPNQIIVKNNKFMIVGTKVVLVQPQTPVPVPDRAITTIDNKALVDSNNNYLLFANSQI